MATIQDIADKLGVSKGTVSKAINNAPDISETLRKTVLDTAVEMGYTRLRRQKNDAKRFCILIENMEYEEPHQFGYDFVIGFRQMAEPAGYVAKCGSCNSKTSEKTPYDVFMLQNTKDHIRRMDVSSSWKCESRRARSLPNPAILSKKDCTFYLMQQDLHIKNKYVNGTNFTARLADTGTDRKNCGALRL